MWGRQQPGAPYGWLSYRQNLLVLYDGLGKTDPKIDELIDKTEYRATRPDFAQQWADVNEIELRLFRHLDDTRLVAETERKFVQAEQSGLSGLSSLRERFRRIDGAGAAAETQRSALAIAFLEEMFVKYSYRYSEREKRAEVSRRLMWFGLAIIGVPTLLVFLGAFVELGSLYLFGPKDPMPSFDAAGPVTLEDWFEPLRWASSRFGAFFVVVYFGILGAYFSRLFGYSSRMKELRWREMDLVYSPGAIMVRLLVGAIGAAIVFFLMMGKILSGPVFLDPGFSLWLVREDGFAFIPLRPSEDFARLIVWCIVAGFFERFVPDRFAEVAESARGSGNPDQRPAA